MDLKINEVYNIDCFEGMQAMKEQGITADWCITDPPYGIGECGKKNHSRSNLAVAKKYTEKDWDNKRIPKKIFEQIFEVSKEQIIFGGNYYTDYLRPSSCWIVWDKLNGKSDFSDCELAWCSQRRGVRKIEYRWQGMLQGNMREKEVRIHPTQKPLPVISWIITKYTKENDLILDPFMGSFTTAVACHKLNRRYIGFELDKEYYELGTNRLKEVKRQITMFDQEKYDSVFDAASDAHWRSEE